MSARRLARLLESKFLKDSATLQVSALLNQLSQIVSSVVIAFLLGSHGQGLFFLAIALQALFYNLVNVGVMQATVTQVAAASVREARTKVAGWLAFLVKSHVLFSTLLIGLGWVVLPALARASYAEKLGPQAAAQLGLWAWWLTFWPLLDTPRAVAQVAFQGTRRMLRLGQLDNGCELMRMFLVTTGALITASPEGAILGEIVSRVFGTLLAVSMYRAARREGESWLPSPREVLRMIRVVPLRQGIRLGLRVGLLKNSQTLFMDVLPGLILGRLAGASWVAYYKLATRITILPFTMLQGVGRTILPALSELRGLRDLDRFRSLYYRSSLISGGLVVGALLVLVPLIPPFVGALFPPDYKEPVFHYSWILALGMVPPAFAVGMDAFYILTDQMKRNLVLMGIGAALTIPTFFYLVAVLPETGVAWGLSLYRSWTLVHFAYVAWYFRHRARRGHWDR